MLLALRSLWEEQSGNVTVELTGVAANCAIGDGTVSIQIVSPDVRSIESSWRSRIVYRVRAYRRGKHARAFAKVGKGTVLIGAPPNVVVEVGRSLRERRRPSAIGIGSLAIDTWIALERSRPAFTAVGKSSVAVGFTMRRRDDVIVPIASGDRALSFVGSGKVNRKVDFLDEELVALLLAA